MHQSFNPHAALDFHPQELKASRSLLCRLLQDPNDVLFHLQQFAVRIYHNLLLIYIFSMSGEIIMSITYGIEVQPKDDPYIITAQRAVYSLATGVVPGGFLVNSFPALKHMPAWMPLAGFQRKAKEWRKLAMAMIHTPYEVVKKNMVYLLLHQFCFYLISSSGKWKRHSIIRVQQSRGHRYNRQSGASRVCYQRDCSLHVRR